MSCSICEEKYTPQTRKKVQCDDCNKSCCLGCFKIYSLSNNFKCMHENCSKMYDFNEICSIANSKLFTTSMNDLVSKQIMIEQKQQLSKYQEARRIRDQKVAMNEKIQAFYIKKKETEEEIKKIRNEADIKIRKLKNFIRNGLPLLYKEKMELEKQLKIVKEEDYKLPVNNFTCSITDCDGILNENFVCTLCGKQMCTECHQYKQEGHLCNQEEVDTIRMIKENSRACPNCGEYISKINGCDQMYCDPKKNGTGCGTFFSYNTGVVDKGSRHNPHWYSRSRELVNGRLTQELNQECLDIFAHTDLGTWLQQIRIFKYDPETIYHFQSVWWFRFNLQRKISRPSIKTKDDKFKAGIDYLANKDKEKWFSKIKKINKYENYYKQRNKCLDFLLLMVDDFIYTFIEKIKNKSITNRWIKDYVYQLDFIEQECTFNFRSKTQHYNFRYNADDEAQIIKIIHPSYRN